jgi:hypothetical protein
MCGLPWRPCRGTMAAEAVCARAPHRAAGGSTTPQWLTKG